MDGTLLQSRLYAGYAKAANKVGQPYSIYRAPSSLSPIDPSNLIGTVNCFFAADQKYTSVHKFKEPTRYMWADGAQLAQRDILVGPYGTFFIGDMQPNLPIQVIRCNDSINIIRTEYIDGIAQDGALIAYQVPVFRQLKKVDQKPVPNVYGASTASTPVGEFFAYVPTDWSVMLQNDTVVDQTGRRYSISTIDPTEIGTVLVIRQADTQEA